ncbi:MAG: guanylate kinase [Firmicutes bacterium]|nr:guanylate kinase [Bacillota bacterium]
MSQHGLLIVISGPSGVGKGTVCQALLRKKADLVFSVSKTTRQPRPGEKDGVNYFFVTPEEFQKSIAEGDFLEYACVYDHYYGTPRRAVERMLAAGRDVILEIDTQGALQVMQTYPQGVFIFLLPPSGAELRSRIIKRGTETEETLKKRLAAAKSEIELAYKYQYVIVNDHVETACERICAIIEAEKMRVLRNKALINALVEEVKA